MAALAALLVIMAASSAEALADDIPSRKSLPFGFDYRGRFRDYETQSRISCANHLSAAVVYPSGYLVMARHRRYRAIAALMFSTFWYVLPSLPMFLVMPALLRNGIGFGPSLALSCALTILLYLLTAWALSKFRINL